MLKSQKTILISILKQNSFQDFYLLKSFSKKVNTELKPRFAFELSQDVKEDFLNEKFKARKHPGAISYHCKNINLPFYIEKEILQIRKERGYEKSYLRTKMKELLNYLWNRQVPFENDELNEKLDHITHKLINAGKMPSEFFEDSGQKSYEDLTPRTIKLLRKDLHNHVYAWKPQEFNDKESFVYLYTRAAPDYAALVRVLTEIRLRDSEFQPSSLFDFGSGVGTVTWAVNTVWPNVCREIYNVDASSSMNALAERLLKSNDDNENESQKSVVYYRQFLPASDNLSYDLVVSSRTLFEVGDLKERARTVDILWRKVRPGGFLVLVEAGTRYGHNVVSEMRDYLLKISDIQTKKYSVESPIHVFAPCPHDKPCPVFSQGLKKPCHFGVSFTYPKDIDRKVRNDLFSYVILQKKYRRGTRDWPRIVEPLMRRNRHVIIRTCDPCGDIREFVTTKNKHGKVCYKICKRCKWGDLLPIHFNATAQVDQMEIKPDFSSEDLDDTDSSDDEEDS